MKNSNKSEELISLLQAKLGSNLLNSKVSLGDAEIRISKSNLLACLNILKLDTELSFDLLVSVTAVDYMDNEFIARVEPERFEMVYHLMSTKTWQRLRIKASVPEGDTKVDSIGSLWSGADFMESEVWDMYGIFFNGHPDLRRILMYEEFKGFPLRKDYPVQGKQPRIPLRKPEVENTARHMHRPGLVQINRKSASVKELRE